MGWGKEGGQKDVWMSFQWGDLAADNFIALAVILGACSALFILGFVIGACVGYYRGRGQLATPRRQTMAQVRQRQSQRQGEGQRQRQG